MRTHALRASVLALAVCLGMNTEAHASSTCPETDRVWQETASPNDARFASAITKRQETLVIDLRVVASDIYRYFVDTKGCRWGSEADFVRAFTDRHGVEMTWDQFHGIVTTQPGLAFVRPPARETTPPKPKKPWWDGVKPM